MDVLIPWVPSIKRFHHIPDVSPYVMAGLLLRESWAGHGAGYKPAGDINGWGDNGRAFSPWQFDTRDPGNFAWINTPDSRTMDGQAYRAAQYLYESRKMLEWAFTGEKLVRAMLAAYNADPRKVLHCGILGDVDSCTTGRNYSAWVLSKAKHLEVVYPTLFNIEVS